ncbi:MAG: ATP-binding cassette domain-containing protein, partial [Polyangiales bacterium]
MENLVEIHDLHVAAKTDSGRTVEIIKGVSLVVAPGEIVALIGESGSGKTTIALTLLGHTRPGCTVTRGSVRVGPHVMTAMTERQRASVRGTDVAYVPQSAAAAFNPAKRLIDQVVEVAAIHDLMPAAEAHARAVDLFRALALPSPETIGERYPHQVSGGQLQRLAAAMALIGDPKLVIFDEPTTALDVTTQIEVLRAFKAVMTASNMAAVYVSHDLAVVAQVADRIVVLRDGQVQEQGPTVQILDDARHPYTRDLLAAFHPRPRAEAAVAASQAPALVLEARGITAGYGPVGKDGQPFKTVLRDVSLALAPGHNLGIIGESGCGKSTLARVLAGLLPPV